MQFVMGQIKKPMYHWTCLFMHGEKKMCVYSK